MIEFETEKSGPEVCNVDGFENKKNLKVFNLVHADFKFI